MTATEVFADFIAAGARLRLDGNDIVVCAPPDVIDARMLDSLKEHKAAIRQMIEEDRGVPPAEYKAAYLNRLFLTQGVTGQKGRITATTVRHGERADWRVRNGGTPTNDKADAGEHSLEILS